MPLIVFSLTLLAAGLGSACLLHEPRVIMLRHIVINVMKFLIVFLNIAYSVSLAQRKPKLLFLVLG